MPNQTPPIPQYTQWSWRWEANVEYYPPTEVALPDKTGKVYVFKCIRQHVASQYYNMPGYGAHWQQYWEFVDTSTGGPSSSKRLQSDTSGPHNPPRRVGA